VVKVHLMCEEDPTAVQAGAHAEPAESVSRGVLPQPDPLEFALSVAAVVVGEFAAR
jgi:hypothetical protein